MRLVIKVGTNVLTDNSYEIKFSRIRQILSEILELHKKKYEVILVTSGAVGSGRAVLPNLNSIQNKQIWAAIGQPLLMHSYQHYASEMGLTVAQCLVLRNDFTDRERYENFVKTIDGLLAASVLPIINENDVVANNDLTVGDNDLLSAMVAVAVKADKLFLLTNQTGLYTSNPDTDSHAQIIKVVEDVDFELEKLCTKEVSTLGRGGMLSKVRAAKHAVHAGVETFIADGRKKGILLNLLGKQYNATRFVPLETKEISGQKRWLLSAKGFGQLIVDDGAAKALKLNKSLLFPGIVNIRGMFDKGEIVEIISKTGAAVAYGKSNYNDKDLQKALQDKKNSPIKLPILEREVVHRDYMVVLNK